VAGLAISFGSGAMTNSIAELEFAKCIFVIGSNTTEAHPVISTKIKKAVVKHGAKLIVADPRSIPLTFFADIHIRQKPGTDVALLNAMMNVIINEGLANEQFVKLRTEGYEELLKVVEKYTPEVAQEICGVPADQIRQAARIYATSNGSSIVYAMGITQHTTGTDNVKTLANLAMLTGNVGRENAGVNPLRGQNNVQGACDMGGLPNVYTGYQPVTSEEVRAKFARAWGVSSLPANIGRTVIEMMHDAEAGKIKMIYIMGENPALTDPNLNRTLKALNAVDFLVVQDIFPTETAQLADVVLPAAAFAEKDGTFTNTERRVQLVRKVIDAPGQARQDWEILCDISARLGYPMNYSGPEKIMEEIASVTPSYGGITYERIERNGLQWPCPSKDHAGTIYLHKDKFTRGLGKFSPIEFIAPAELPDEEYPFIMTTGRYLEHYHTGTMDRRSFGFDELCPPGTFEINPEDALKLGIKEGDTVRIASRRGEVQAKAYLTDRVEQGTIFISFHFREAAANLLTNDALDPVSKIPEYKVCAVKVEKISS